MRAVLPTWCLSPSPPPGFCVAHLLNSPHTHDKDLCTDAPVAPGQSELTVVYKRGPLSNTFKVYKTQTVKEFMHILQVGLPCVSCVYHKSFFIVIFRIRSICFTFSDVIAQSQYSCTLDVRELAESVQSGIFLFLSISLSLALIPLLTPSFPLPADVLLQEDSSRTQVALTKHSKLRVLWTEQSLSMGLSKTVRQRKNKVARKRKETSIIIHLETKTFALHRKVCWE